MKSYMASPATIERKWYVVDATGYTLGRLASEVAKILRGKNKPIFTPFIDTGDYVIITNADKIKVTGVLKEPSTNNIFNNFNYKKYLYNKKIYYIILLKKPGIYKD